VTRALLLLAAVVALAGCGGDDEASETTQTTGSEGKAAAYFLRDGKVWPVARDVDAANASEVLADGPTEDEAAALDLTTELPAEDPSDEALAQLVYTLSADQPGMSVDVGRTTHTRADFEEQTPSVLVESPLAFQEVSSPLWARGTANTYEATFSFEILDVDGKVIASDFVTATSGSGERGTFRFEQPFVVDEEQDGALRVFELSAEDGSRSNEVEIPLRLLP
jgi:hypothetical protein